MILRKETETGYIPNSYRKKDPLKIRMNDTP